MNPSILRKGVDLASEWSLRRASKNPIEHPIPFGLGVSKNPAEVAVSLGWKMDCVPKILSWSCRRESPRFWSQVPLLFCAHLSGQSSTILFQTKEAYRALLF